MSSENNYRRHIYINELDWKHLEDNQDPGDPCKHVYAHIIPHKDFQLPSLVEAISKKESDDLVRAARAEVWEEAVKLTDEQFASIKSDKVALNSLAQLVETFEEKANELRGEW